MSAILLPAGDERPPAVHEQRPDREEIASILTGYLREAEEARKGGMNPRDDKWSEILDLYWNRYDFGEKADWQAKEITPQVPTFVDRFAAALKEAFGVAAAGMYTVLDPSDTQHALTEPIKRMTDAWLSTAGRNASGQPLGFEAVFEDQMKMAALMASTAVVTWKDDTEHGRVAVETEDPRNIWLDHTFRGLYRIRRIELDKHRLMTLAKMRDGGGRPLYNLDEIEGQATDLMSEMKRETEERTGIGAEISSTRTPLVLHEYYGDIVRVDGSLIAENSLTVVADGKWVIRGPEKNPFWHGRDWITYTPMITVPLSPYGRAYVEDFSSMARMYNKITNLILDAVAFSSIKVFATIPEMLADPSQLDSGITMGKNFKLQFGMGSAQEFISAVELGSLSPDAVRVWQMVKNELTEAGNLNEVGLGQFAPHSRTSATEIAETQQSSSALIRSVAQTIEQRWFEPLLDLVWKTGLQHVSRNDRMIADAAGPEMFQALMVRRKELIQRPMTFQARGLSTLIYKRQKLGTLIELLQIIASNEILLQQFMQVVDMAKLVDMMFDLASLDVTRIRRTEQEQMIQQMTQGLGGGGQAGGEPPAAAADAVNALGIGRS